MSQLLLSLFPNIGMLDLAFEEEWPEACVVRGPDLIYNALSDVRRFHPPSGPWHGVIGGPPCQSFSSLAHLVRRNGHEPRFGNLIPEFERCIAEAQPDWFVMENVEHAPTPKVEGYGITSFLLSHETLDGGDGLGLEQMRTRRFSFGRRRAAAADLRKWIRLAALKLPAAALSRTVTQAVVNNDPELKGRVLKSAVIGHGGATPHQRMSERYLKRAVVGGQIGRISENPNPNRTLKNTVIGGHSGITAESERARYRTRKHAVVGGHGVPPHGSFQRYPIEEMCRLQGLPEDFLKDTPWLSDAKRDVIAAGVPLPMGRAIARAVRQALGFPLVEEKPA